MRTPVINVMDRAARRAGRNLARDFGEAQQLQTSRKGTDKFVAAAVRKAAGTLRYELEKARPDFVYYGDPADPGAVDGGHRWIVSALDSIANFAHGLPHFALSIAHEDNGNLAEAMIYDPLRDEVFWAVRNTGAFLNDSRLRVSARQHLSDSIIANGVVPNDDDSGAVYLSIFSTVSTGVAGFRTMGVAALDLAYVAAGRLDGAWYLGAEPAEVAAGTLIVRESGGFISDFAGREPNFENGDFVAANDRLHGALLDRIKDGNKNAEPAAD